MPHSTPVWGTARWTQGVENGTNPNVDPTFIFNFYTQQAYLAPFSHNAKRDRQTERSEEAADKTSTSAA